MWPEAKFKSEFFMPPFGLHIPDAPKAQQTHNIYPLTTLTEAGFDLDYSCLLLSDGLIIDKTARAFVFDDRRPAFKDMRHSIIQLEQEDLVRVVDFVDIARPLHDAVREKVSTLLEDPIYWLSPLRRNWALYRPVLDQHLARLGHDLDSKTERLNFGVYCYLLAGADKINLTEAEKVSALVETRRRRLTKGETEAVREIIRPYLSHIIMNHSLIRELKCTFLDWQDMDPFYAKLMILENKDNPKELSSKDLQSCRHLFDVVTPELKPRSAKLAIAFMKNNAAVRSLRATVREAAQGQIVFDKKWAEEVRSLAVAAMIANDRRARKFRLYGSLAFGALGIAPIYVDHAHEAIEVVREFAEQGTDHVSPRGMAKYQWLYTLIESRYNDT